MEEIKIGDNIYLVRLTRNSCSGVMQLSGDVGNERRDLGDSATRLLALDYYDQMAYISYDQLAKKHPNRRPNSFFFGQYDPFDQNDPVHPPLSHLLMTLVEIEGMDHGSDLSPFNSDAELPFFSLISVIRTPSLSDPVVPEDPLKYLKRMYNEIEPAVCAVCDDNQHIAYKILYSMNSGGFVVALRSSAIETAYNVALRIRACNDYGYETFTTAAIECAFDPEGYPIPFHTGNSHKTHIAIRLLVDSPDTINKIKEQVARDDSNTHSSIGLYGRYDVSFSLTMQQFSHLFCTLCAYKFATKIHNILPLVQFP